MDEYLFIAMAKLKADRLKLEREQREAQRSQSEQERPVDDHQYSARVRWFNRALQWREQS